MGILWSVRVRMKVGLMRILCAIVRLLAWLQKQYHALWLVAETLTMVWSTS